MESGAHYIPFNPGNTFQAAMDLARKYANRYGVLFVVFKSDAGSYVCMNARYHFLPTKNHRRPVHLVYPTNIAWPKRPYV